MMYEYERDTKNRKIKLYTIGVVLIALVVGAVILAKQNIGAIKVPPKDEIVEDIDETPVVQTETNAIISKLKLPAGFQMNIFAQDIKGARVMIWDNKGRMLVSQTSEGKISVVSDTNFDGISDETKTLVDKLDDPHGMAFKCDTETTCQLYIAEHSKLSRYDYDNATATVSNYKKLMDLPSAATDRHTTRTLLFLGSPNENTLLVSVGSSCNVCNETTLRGKILSYNVTTGKSETYATGLRNSVFMALDILSGKVFATEMGRDGLGDTTPPDEINIIEKGKNYGWPVCYGKNIHDTEFDKNTYIRNPCMDPLETSSFVDLPAHSAPLGLAFIPEEGWDESYWYNLLVAYHGSWNSSVPTGYKIVRIKLDTKGKYVGTEDFITGWLTSDGTKIGRPADINVLSGGTIYISDDMNGLIYRMTRK